VQTTTDEQDQKQILPDETEAENTPETEGAQDAAGDSGGAEADEANTVEIDGHRFASEADALKWALSNKAQLEREKELADAYRSGISDSQVFTQGQLPQVTPAKQEDEDPNFEERFYANPKEVLKELTAKAKREAFEELQRVTSARDIEREVWDKFTSAHPDLADFKEDVETIANHNQHKEIIQALVRTKGQEAAMNYVAQKTRAKFQAYAEATKQKTVLPRGAGPGTTPTGSDKKVTLPKKEEKPMSMKDQLRQLKNKHR